MSFTFAPATREQSKARIALAGPSGSGKTYTALSLATNMAPRVALIDTERGSASKYAAGKLGAGFTFDTLQMSKYDPRDLVKALAAAGQAGYGAVIVDSLSHFWMGTGGMLELVDSIGKRSGGGGQWGGWKDARPFERAMIDALLSYPGHVIVTMRTKSEWVIETNERGKPQPKKVGTKAEQRDGIEYEFDIVGDLDLENTLVISKSRCDELSGAVINRPGSDMAATVLAWLEDGVEVPDAVDLVDEAMNPALTVDGALALHAKTERHRLLGAAILHPETGAPMSLGELIVERGRQLRANGGRPSGTPGPTQPSSSTPGSGTTGVAVTAAAAGPGAPDRQAAIDALRSAALVNGVERTIEADFRQSYGVSVEDAPVAAIREMTQLLRGAA
ncbi:ATP-binding protein [Kitasatospora cathayae]|uniref:ATP-binding protein n=1 Tax=Kitasatospora cathayae TaxID=3004092 RepID=A0ABY7QBJ3_9ACTN|nr:ATP-binding protein [Kitasatospora sp. HUAS 3-15]WBP89481.1 ATP-binding protein [Kitasatospora sp. HUAS 3-15]